MTPWLTIIGVGEGDHLAEDARAILASAEIIIGAPRHLARWAPASAEQWSWETPLSTTIERIAAAAGRRVVVLATGDPMWFGIGVTLGRRFSAEEMRVLPAAGAFSLAAARLGWPLAEISCLTLHGRPVAGLARHLLPGARLLILSHDRRTPGEVARALTAAGYGASRLIVLSEMASATEARVDGVASDWPDSPVADLNTIAVTCVAAPGLPIIGRSGGLPDSAFEHDGQLTKRPLRAAALAHLAPRPGDLLWDVGAGAGSIAIEFLRLAGGARAVAIEWREARLGFIARNAQNLGTSELVIIEGVAPAVLDEVATREGAPDAIFLGGGVGGVGVIEACLTHLKPGGRLVAHAVTLDGEAALLAAHGRWRGELTRFQTAAAEPVGPHFGWRAAMPVTQWVFVKDLL